MAAVGCNPIRDNCIMLIGILGRIDSGKGTVADELVNTYGFRQDSFAATLKDVTAVLFNWNRAMLEGNKFRLGLRKVGISAHSLSTEVLISQYFEPKLPKDKHKIAQVLRLRNVMIPDSLPTEDEATVE